MILGWFKKPRQVEHDFCQDNMSAYIDDAVSPRQKARLERHLSECLECRQTLSELRATVTLLRQTPALPVPRSFALPLSVGVPQPERRAFRLNPGYLRLAASAATVVLILVVSGDLLLRNGFLGSRESQAPTPEAYGRGAESPMVGTALNASAEPTELPAAPLMMAPAPAAQTTAVADTQLVTDNAGASATSQAEVTSGSQTLSMQALPSETFARPAGAPLPATSTPDGGTVPPPVAMEKSAVATAVPTEEPTATPTPTPTATPTPEPTATPAAVGMGTSTGTVVAVSLLEERPAQPGAAVPLSTDSAARRETILQLLRWLEMALGGMAVVLLSLNLWLRLTHQPA